MNTEKLINTLKKLIDKSESECCLGECLEMLGCLTPDSLQEEDEVAKAFYSTLGSCEEVYSERVGPDLDTIKTVFHFKDHNIFLANEASYSSYEGNEYENEWYEVFPVEVKITEYHRVKRSND
jgi:hypothetical protein